MLVSALCSVVRVFISSIILIIHSVVSLLNKSELDTITLGEGDSWALAITNNEEVLSTGGERVSTRVLDVTNIEGTWMLLDGLEDTNSTDVVSTSQVNRSTIDELVNTLDALVSQVNL